MRGTNVIRKGYADTPAGQVHYLRCGEGRPLVLLHQSPAAATMWEAVLPLFGAAGYAAIAIDLPGHGDSWRPEQPPSIPDYARSVAATLDALGLARVDIVGHHTGALVAAQVAVDFPARVGKLALWGLAIYVEALAESRARLKNEQPPAGMITSIPWSSSRSISRWYISRIACRPEASSIART